MACPQSDFLPNPQRLLEALLMESDEDSEGSEGLVTLEENCIIVGTKRMGEN